MKKIYLLCVLVAILNSLNAQITLSKRYTVNSSAYPQIPYVTKLGISGKKIVFTNFATKTLELYNLNHSLFKSISIPTTALPNGSVLYISETLFDNDPMIEFVYQGITGTNPNLVQKFYIYKENGTQVFFKDSAQMQTSTNWNDATNMTEPIFFDGTKTVMRLTIGFNLVGYEYYTLPGSLPCDPCGTPGSVGRPENASNYIEPLFYPNPASGQLKLKYTLPADYKTALIRVQDSQGKLVEEFKITDAFDHLMLPESYNNGLYIYSLIVDDKVIKHEKIILAR